jgi:hypothetical protein
MFMRKMLSLIIVLPGLITGCRQTGGISTMKGYVVYEIPGKIRFVAVKRQADTDYARHFASDNFAGAIAFKPNCAIQQIVEAIKPDTLLDENPDMKGAAAILRSPLVFPAEIKVVDTSLDKKKEDPETARFKMIYKGSAVEFDYANFQGVIVDLHRLN